MGIPGVRKQKMKRLAVRVEVGLFSGFLGLVGFGLLVAAGVLYLSTLMPMVAALSIMAMVLFLVAGIAFLIQRIWEAGQTSSRDEEDDQGAHDPMSTIQQAIDTATSGPMGMASSALVARQVRKAPITTAAGLAAIGLLMATRDRRSETKDPGSSKD